MTASPRKAIRRMSEKKLKALGGRAFSTISKPSGPPRKRNPARKKREWLRVYGTAERVRWVQDQKCVACGAVPSENAHIETGGMGRKADAKYIVPLCTEDHGLLHHWGRERFEQIILIDLDVEAKKTELAWSSRIQEIGA